MNLRRNFVLALVAVGLSGGLLGGLHSPSTALAHPLGNFTINRLTLVDIGVEGKITLRYIVDSAEIPTFQQLRSIDRDGDGSVSETEKHNFLAVQAPKLLGNLRLEIGGRKLKLEQTASDLTLLSGQGGLQTSRVVIDASAALPDGWTQGASASIRDENYPGQAGWRQVVVRPGTGINLSESTAAIEDVTAELTAYPVDLLKSPPAMTAATFAFRPGESVPAGATTTQGASIGRDSANKTLGRFASLVSRQRLTPGFVALALLLAAGWGAMHALGPGHGKTVVAAYLVGERGTGRHALFQGLVVTTTHTVSVFALGGIALLASEVLSAKQIYAYLGAASGILVVIVGSALLISRVRNLLRDRRPSLHEHHHGEEHHHEHESHDEDHHGHEHGTDHHGYEHEHGHSHAPTAPGWRGLVALGVSGGLVPCPTALVVMLGAIAVDRTAYGLALVTAFSVGLAGVLMSIGLLLVFSQRLLNGSMSRLPFLNSALFRSARLAAPILSAAAVLIVGLVLTSKAVL
jgi:nickel/cobalt exporter